MLWTEAMWLFTVTLILMCRASKLVQTHEQNVPCVSDRMNFGNCHFIPPDRTQLRACRENNIMGDYSRCQCEKNGSYIFCSSRNFRHVPTVPSRSCVLLLDNNYITEIADTTFEHSSNLSFLDLSYNNISTIGNNSFTGLYNLETLLLHHNKLHYLLGSLLSINFSHMIKLRCLRIEQQTTKYDDNEEYPITPLQSLPNLHTLYMNGIPGRPFTEEFSNLSNLHEFVLNGVDGYCNLSRVERDMFQNLSQISALSLIRCNLTFVENGSFSELHRLKSLNLSFNEGLQFKSLSNITYGLTNLTQLGWLNLTKIHSTYGRCTSLDSSMLRYINQTTVKQLVLDQNRLSDITVDAVDFFPKRLTYLSIDKNKIDIGLYLVKTICTIQGTFMDLQTLKVSNQNYRRHSFELFSLFSQMSLLNYEGNGQPNDHFGIGAPPKIEIVKCILNILHECNNTCPKHTGPCPYPSLGLPCIFPFPLPLPKNLETMDFSGSLFEQLSLENACFCRPNNLTNLKLNRNLIYSFAGPFYGFESLRTLDLAQNYCQNITDNSFSNMTNLRALNLSSNYLGSIITSVSPLLPFKTLVNLHQLDLSNNKLRTLPLSLFSNLHNIRYLSLSENRLNRFEVNVSDMVNLVYLDLSVNLIETFTSGVMASLNKIAARNKLKINLYVNKFTCICKYEEYIKWIVNNNGMFVNFTSYYCFFDNGDSAFLAETDLLDRLRKECTDYTTMVLVTSLCVGISLIGILVSVLYRYRWRLRYMYYSAKIRYRGYSRVDEDDHFQYDIFVSYADTDKVFIRETMIPELEQSRGLRLLIHERDFPFGQLVTENIHKAISSSQKTLLFISRGFIQSKWCKYEMNIAKVEEIKRDREVICVVMTGQVKPSDLPTELTAVIARNTYLTLPSNPDDMGRFWDTLQAAF